MSRVENPSEAAMVTPVEALRFMETACRNWPHIERLSYSDIQDMADALTAFRRAGAAPQNEVQSFLEGVPTGLQDGSLSDHDVKDLIKALRDPEVVHVNMLRGAIANPSPSTLLHIYGEQLVKDLAGISSALQDAVDALDAVHQAQVLPDHGYGWSITALNKTRPLVAKALTFFRPIGGAK